MRAYSWKFTRYLSRLKILPRLFIVSTLLAPTALWAGPEGGEIVGGSGRITQGGKATTIKQNTDRMAIEWQSYDVAVDERVRYIQPDASSVSLNSILSKLSTILLKEITLKSFFCHVSASLQRQRHMHRDQTILSHRFFPRS